MGAEHTGLWALRISSKWSTSSLLRWKPDLPMFAEGRAESAVYWLLSFKLNYMMPDHQINVHPYRPPNHPPVCWTMLTLTTGIKVSMLLPALGTLQYLFPRLTLSDWNPGAASCFSLHFLTTEVWDSFSSACFTLVSFHWTVQCWTWRVFLTGLFPSCWALKVHCLVQA